MDYAPLIFLTVMALIAGRFFFAWLKYGSMTGAYLKGRVEETFGEVEIWSDGFNAKRVLRVMQLRDDDGQTFVGFVIAFKTSSSTSVTPYGISKEQARELSDLFSIAAGSSP